MARLLPSASVLPTLLMSPVWAAQYELHPTYSVSQYYTDNVALGPSGQERGDWVTVARPGVAFDYNGARLKFRADAAAEVLYHAAHGTSTVKPQLRAGTVESMELVPQLLYFDTNATVQQRNVSVLANASQDNINTTGNRATVTTTRVSPFLRHAAGSTAVTQLRYSLTRVDLSGNQVASGAGNSTGNRIELTVASGPAYKLTSWNVAYAANEIDYDSATARDLRTQSFTVGARRLITPVAGLLVNAGYNDTNYVSATSASPRGAQWSVGFDWTPTLRTKLAATSGRRHYGPWRSLDFNHHTRLTVWALNYSEQITTYHQQLLQSTEADTATYLDTLYQSQIPDAAARQQAVQNAIAQSGLPPTLTVPEEIATTRTILAKTWRGTVGLRSPRHTVLANFFSTTQETLSVGQADTSGDFSTSSTLKQSGAGLVWNWAMTALDSANVTLNITRTEIPGQSRQDDRKSARAGYTRQFGPHTSGTLSVQRYEKTSTTHVAEFRENRVWASVQMRY